VFKLNLFGNIPAQFSDVVTAHDTLFPCPSSAILIILYHYVNCYILAARWVSQAPEQGDQGSIPGIGNGGTFSLRHRVQIEPAPPPAFLFYGYRVSSEGVKRPGREADHSPNTSSRSELN
jgi:hypothetical protein